MGNCNNRAAEGYATRVRINAIAQCQSLDEDTLPRCLHSPDFDSDDVMSMDSMFSVYFATWNVGWLNVPYFEIDDVIPMDVVLSVCSVTWSVDCPNVHILTKLALCCSQAFFNIGTLLITLNSSQRTPRLLFLEPTSDGN